MNEPVDGGRLGVSAAAWDNEKLWPFYRRVRTVLDDAGWADKLVFAGPSAFWNTNLGLPGGNQGLLRTGGGHLSAPPGPGYVFAPHFYDIGRLGGLVRSPPGRDAYLRDFDRIRTEGRFLELPVFVGEFGTRVTGGMAPDPARMIGAAYAGWPRPASAAATGSTWRRRRFRARSGSGGSTRSPWSPATRPSTGWTRTWWSAPIRAGSRATC